jgi:hypothetical protein
MGLKAVSAWGVMGSFIILFSLGIGEGEAGAGQDVEVEAEVASAFDPVVVLLGQDGSDEAGQGVAGGEDADHIGRAVGSLD